MGLSGWEAVDKVSHAGVRARHNGAERIPRLGRESMRWLSS